MNDYTAGIIHDERTAQFRREADASRLAFEARQGRAKRKLSSLIRSLGVALARSTERRTRMHGREAAKVTQAAE